MTAGDRPRAQVPAARYMRMSTEHQRYSIDSQADAIAEFAAARGYELVADYVDRGRSGLSIRQRDGLKQLLADAIGGEAIFRTILVYDVSRWGRFQDIDQAAHYEFLCRDAGINIEYCAEPFTNDGSLIAHLLKSLKRAGAAEFSRELSVKVTAGQRRAAAMGYWTGGEARYGFRRQLVDEQDKPIQLLAPGERKALQHHRVRLVAGPEEELKVVRRIFRRYAAGETPSKIAGDLRADQVPGWCGIEWSKTMIRRMVIDERYAGVWAYGTSKCDVVGGRARNVPRADWLRQPGRLPRIVDQRTWIAAQGVRQWRRGVPDERFMLAGLRKLLATHGRLTRDLVASARGVPTPKMYRKVFGDLKTAFRRVGYEHKPRRKLMGPYLARMETLVREGAHQPPGNRPDADAIFETIRAEGYQGSRMTALREVGRLRTELGCVNLPKLNWRSQDEILAAIRALYEKHGYLTMGLIANHPHLPSLSALENHFGSFTQLYELVGCHGERKKWRLGPFADRIEQLVEIERQKPRAHRMSYTELFEMLITEGFRGSYTSLRKHLAGTNAAGRGYVSPGRGHRSSGRPSLSPTPPGVS